MKKKSFYLFVLLLSAITSISYASDERLTKFVNPYIGTGGHGHVFLGANVPFGLVQAGPTEPTRGWDWCSGYHYSDSVLLGFSQMHLSGTGVGELGDITLLPVFKSSQRSFLFSHNNEEVKPGYYSLRFGEKKDAMIQAEISATKRVAIHHYCFSESNDSNCVLLNLKQGIGWDRLTDCKMTLVNDTLLIGYRYSTGWAKNQQIYFAAAFSKPITLKFDTTSTIGIISFKKPQKEITIKIALSPVSTDNAQLNMRTEMPHWNFERVVAEADKAWNEQLNKIKIKTNDLKARRIFYTCLYHTMTAPSVFCDVNGDYRGSDGMVHHANFTNYTTLSLWDTYRAAHPLSTIIHPEVQKDFAETMLAIFREQGKLPVWHLMGNETNCMVGNPAIPVIIDIALKGFDVDKQAILNAANKSAMLDERSLGLLKKYGYIPCNLEPANETVAKGLEYALADYCIAELAKNLGEKDIETYYENRSQSWRNYFDESTKFMRGRVYKEGSTQKIFRTPFDPFHATPQKDDYTEGNAWQYTWLVPHDVNGLIKAFGGEKSFIEKLDSLFIVEGDLGDETAPDITGLIGQYAHGNEPSHHIIYLYDYTRQPYKAAPLLRQVMTTLYRDSIDGLCGNEDVGQMSAWYILSSMGIYQVEPAGGKYMLGTPLFDEVSINVGNGKTFTIIARDNSSKNIYVQRAWFNGKRLKKPFIMFDDIKKGGTLTLQMGDKPKKL